MSAGRRPPGPGAAGRGGAGPWPQAGPCGKRRPHGAEPQRPPRLLQSPPGTGGRRGGDGEHRGGPEPVPPSLGTGAPGSLGAALPSGGLWAVPLPGPCC